jgi:hypothetical protein
MLHDRDLSVVELINSVVGAQRICIANIRTLDTLLNLTAGSCSLLLAAYTM